MEYYGNALCVSYDDLVGGGIMSAANYKQLAHRGKLSVVRAGKGLGNCALVAVDSLPEKYKAEVRKMYPEGNKTRLMEWVKKNYEIDANAAVFFSDPKQTLVRLNPEKQHEYIVNASVLNCCIRLYNRAVICQKMFGNRYNWDEMAGVIACLRTAYGHTLPESTMRFRKKVSEYRKWGYSSLISGKIGNQSARKVTKKEERAIICLASLPNKPYNTNVAEMWNMFVTGELEVFDPKTGELLDPDDYTDKKGDPIVLSETTITNYLNRPKNRLLIDHAQKSWTTFMHENAPHVHRHGGSYSLSKVSLDDRDLPRKESVTKERPKAYYAYDVTSGCCIGQAYSRKKNTDLVMECFRSLLRTLERHGLGCPGEIEVEHHLMGQWRESFLKAGVVFPFVRFCAPTNSQEKYAEQMNGAKKRSVEKKNHEGIGRFYAKDRHYRTESKKIFDEKNDTYEDKEYYSWEQLIADDLSDIREFNNQLHPDQKRFKGMTRWQVFIECQNAELKPLNKMAWARYVGEHVRTSIRRNSYCTVCGESWWLSDVEVIEKLEPNNLEVDAYYLRDDDGKMTEVWIYQNDLPIDRLENVGTFNRNTLEQTDKDRAVFVEQQKKIAKFGKYVRENAISRVGVMEKAANKQHTEPIAGETTGMEAEPAETAVESWRFKDETDAINDI